MPKERSLRAHELLRNAKYPEKQHNQMPDLCQNLALIFWGPSFSTETFGAWLSWKSPRTSVPGHRSPFVPTETSSSLQVRGGTVCSKQPSVWPPVVVQ